jgi:predicted Zn-ribbon and HTH transcriptional regulator
MKKQAKVGKLEQYGPRSMPLLRRPGTTDEEWAKTKLDFDAAMRRMGKKVTWAPPRCACCGTDKGPFSALMRTCPECSKRAVKELLSTL